MRQSDLSVDVLTSRVGVLSSLLFVSGLSALIAISSNSSTFWLLGLWTFIFVLVLLLLIRPKFVEVLFFFLPLIYPVIPALSGLSPIAIACFWLVVMSFIWYTHSCMNGWEVKSVNALFIFPLALYTILVILSMVVNKTGASILSSFSQCVALMPIYWILVQTLTGRDLRRIVYAVIFGAICGTLVYLLAIGGRLSQLPFNVLALSTLRPTVLNYNPNSWAMCPLTGLPIMVAMIVHSVPKISRLIWLIPMTLLLLFVALLLMSRSALMAIGFSSIFVLFTHPRGRRVLFIGGLLATVSFSVYSSSLMSFLGPLFRLQAGLSGREEFWTIAWGIITDHPLLGLGLGGYGDRRFYYVAFVQNGLDFIINRNTVHSVFFQIGVDIGILGILIVLLIYVVFIIRSHRLWNKLKYTRDFPLLVAICALMMAGFIRGIFEVDFSIPHGYLTDNLILITLLAIQDQLVARS